MSAVPTLALCFALALPLSARADVPQWESVADVDTVRVLTSNEDGTLRDTKVWLVVVEGEAYLRTGDTRWGANARRNPDLSLRIGEATYDLRAEFVEDAELRQRIGEAFREKYGFSDAFVGIFRPGQSQIMRLGSR